MRYLPSSQFDGELFDSNVAAIVPLDPVNLPAIYAFCTSQEYRDAVRAIDQAPKVTNATLVKVPFDLNHWRKIAESRSPAGPGTPSSVDPTQWIFEGFVDSSADSLQVAVARLLGYHWPEQKNDGLRELIDDDGIVCIPAVRGEQPAASRLQRLLSFAFGKRWSANKQDELLANADCKGWTLERWLHERFFHQHCKLFHNRPFIWHIWDGLKKSGFSALVNYHKLNSNLLETLTYNYLGDWIRRQTATEMSTIYSQRAWRADASVWRALACVEQKDDLTAVTAAVRSIYQPWVEAAAERLQDIVITQGFPVKGEAARESIEPTKGECVFFADALRFDVGQALREELVASGFVVDTSYKWQGLPSVTGTYKPAVSPIANLLTGTVDDGNFVPSIEENVSILGESETPTSFSKAPSWASWSLSNATARILRSVRCGPLLILSTSSMYSMISGASCNSFITWLTLARVRFWSAAI